VRTRQAPTTSDAPKKPLLEERKSEFSDEQVKESWQAFITMRKEQGASDMEQLVLGRVMSKLSETQVKILLDSQLEISILERFESELVQHLRKSLDNTFVTIEKEVSEEELTKNLYTSREKFDYMAQQNPALIELKERLGLDFDF